MPRSSFPTAGALGLVSLVTLRLQEKHQIKTLAIAALLSIASGAVLSGCADRDNVGPTAPPERPLQAVLPTTNLLAGQTTITLPIQWPSGLTFDGTFLYLSTIAGPRDVFKLDPQTGATAGSFPLGGNPRGLVFDGGSHHLFASNMDGFVDEIDLAGARINAFPLPPFGNGVFRGGGIAFDGTDLYIGNIDDDTIIVTNRSGAVHGGFPLPVNVRPAGIVFDPTTDHLWVITPFNSNIYETTKAGQLVRTCESPFTPGPYGLGGITLVGSKFYIAEPAGGDPTSGTNILILDRNSLVCDLPIVRTVAIDIRPGKFPNNINLRSRGTVPVAILGSVSFNVRDVAVNTVNFAGASALRPSFADVNRDGQVDLVFRSRARDLLLTPTSTDATVTGRTLAGMPFRGTDEVRIVQCVGKSGDDEDDDDDERDNRCVELLPDITMKGRGVIIGGAVGGAGGTFVAWDAFADLSGVNPLPGTTANGRCAFNVTYIEENRGAAPTSPLYTNKLKLRGPTDVAINSLRQLNAGESKSVTTQPYLTEGRNDLMFYLDDGNVVAESNERNNAFSIKYSLKCK